MDRDDHRLFESAPLAHEYATRHCCQLPGTAGTCAWYHGVWQFFRALGVVASPWTQAGFYRDTLGRATETTPVRRILISGASDYGMLSVILNACETIDRTPEITVVDRCPTPLYLNRWYAERRSLTVRTGVSDLLSYRNDEPFDLICTHSFLGNFAPETRPRLVRRWHSLLRPGGKLILTNRVRPGAEGPQRFSTTARQEFVQRVLAAGQRLQNALPVSLPTLERWATEYARRYRSHPVTSGDDFLALLERTGFALEVAEVDGSPENTSSAPSTPGRAMRLHLVATRT